MEFVTTTYGLSRNVEIVFNVASISLSELPEANTAITPALPIWVNATSNAREALDPMPHEQFATRTSTPAFAASVT